MSYTPLVLILTAKIPRAKAQGSVKDTMNMVAPRFIEGFKEITDERFNEFCKSVILYSAFDKESQGDYSTEEGKARVVNLFFFQTLFKAFNNSFQCFYIWRNIMQVYDASTDVIVRQTTDCSRELDTILRDIKISGYIVGTMKISRLNRNDEVLFSILIRSYIFGEN